MDAIHVENPFNCCYVRSALADRQRKTSKGPNVKSVPWNRDTNLICSRLTVSIFHQILSIHFKLFHQKPKFSNISKNSTELKFFDTMNVTILENRHEKAALDFVMATSLLVLARTKEEKDSFFKKSLSV